MIQRRTLLKSSAAAVALGAPGLSGLAQQAVTLKFHTFMAPQSNVWLTMHKPWMEKVEKDSGGRIKFDDKGRRAEAGLVIIQWQNGVPVTVYPPDAAVAQPIWPKK